MNETPSLTDPVLKDSESPFNEPNATPVYEKLPSINEIIEKYRDLILEHVSRRIAFFFQQLICCYQTKLHFEIGHVVSQGSSARKAVLVDQNLKSLDIERHAAHSSTLPCLIAYDAEEWAAYQTTKEVIPTGYVFLKGTDSYRLWNATITMPRWINMVDLQIDGTSRDKKLRYKTLQLINAAAQGKIDPEQGLELFIKLAMDQVKLCSKMAKQEMYVKILKIYEYELTSTQASFNHNRFMWLDRLLDIKVSDEVSRELLYQIRYQAIREAQIDQAKLLETIDITRQKILSEYTRKPTYFEAAFLSLLLLQTHTKENRQRLEKLYNFSYFDFKSRLNQARLKIFDTTKTLLLEKHGEQLAKASSRAVRNMQALRKKEAMQRGLITKQLRLSKKWTQKVLGEKLCTSPSTISRIENCHKLITPPIAESLSTIFGIDAGIFMPHFFYD